METGTEHDVLISKVKEFIFSEDDETSLAFEVWLETVQLASTLLPNHHRLKKVLNALMSDSMTPLLIACIYGLEDVLPLLVEKEDFDADVRNLLGHTALYLAASSGGSC
ncbi:hypothetical protein N7471_006328 [Penicillium samsonianum]|uniref:uncharacterized protein n=1 Tax=Penicillium samsonianum TaxID=1882272 RepID=UPI002548B0B4|nr:uncharacterized protein N7471_006328 [Penicillium samsonianum]KAJ6139842.1 hypothetical protein N7471_006328 [Penicillium samsonianum]